MPVSKRKTWEGRVYLGLDANGREQYEWVGRFTTKRERDEAVALRRVELRQRQAVAQLPPGDRTTVAEYADRVLERKRDGRLVTKQGRRFKLSTLDTWASGSRRVVEEFGERTLAAVTRSEAVVWAESQPAGVVAVAVGLYGLAVDEELLARNPFRGLVRRGRGRADAAPPTPAEFDALLDACSVLGDYAGQMRALLTVGAYTGMTPGELFALEWADIDLAAHRVHVRRRLYRGDLDLPKSNRERAILRGVGGRYNHLQGHSEWGDLARGSSRPDLTKPPQMRRFRCFRGRWIYRGFAKVSESR